MIASSLALAATALGDGGSSVAAATPVIFGQQEFGNTASSIPTSNGIYYSYWTLGVTAGDSVTIDWAAYTGGQCGPRLAVFAVGTNDFNIGNVNDVADQLVNQNGMNELPFSAPVTGSMPMRFDANPNDCGPTGPYNFTAYVSHEAILSLPPFSRLPRRGSLPIGVHNPDGGRISSNVLSVALEVRTPGKPWRIIGRAHPQIGISRVPFQVPKSLYRKRVILRAYASGASYRPASSRSGAVTVR
jgi:hypothetical protein